MFRDTIKKLVDRLEGGVGGVLMGFDGITVDSYGREGMAGVVDIQTIGLEFAHLIAQARRTAQSLNIGLIRELTFRTDKLTVLVQILNKDYFVACAFLSSGASAGDFSGPAQPSGSDRPTDAAGGAVYCGGEKLGRARYLMRITAPRIEAEL
jgi:predicted regulator of Ras-like GTPase activity (Roadblock/LC7/MglB family)